MNKRINFKWNGVEYSVRTEVAHKDYVVLPNRKVLKVKTCWNGVDGLEVTHLEEVHNPLQHAHWGEILEYFPDSTMANTVC